MHSTGRKPHHYNACRLNVLVFAFALPIWPTCKEIPPGWNGVDKVGPKQECLDYVKEVWVDMRPKSLKDAENQRKLLN